MLKYVLPGETVRDGNDVRIHVERVENNGSVAFLVHGYVVMRLHVSGEVDLPGNIGLDAGLRVDAEGRVGIPLTESS